jgi:hypothetical protein
LLANLPLHSVPATPECGGRVRARSKTLSVLLAGWWPSPAPQFIDRFRYNANRAALVQSRIKALERMADVEVMEEDPGGAGARRSCLA